MTLGHSTLYYILWTTQSMRLPDAGHPRRDGGNCLLKSRVVGGLSPAAPFMTSQRVSVLSQSSHVYTVSCAHTSDPVSLHCNHSLYNLAVGKQTASVHISNAAWSKYGAWQYGLSHARRPTAAAGPSYLLSAICLSRRKPWNCRCVWQAWPAHVDHTFVQALDLATHPHCVEGTNILLLVTTSVRINQLHTTWTVIFSWNPYPHSWDTIKTGSSSW